MKNIGIILKKYIRDKQVTGMLAIEESDLKWVLRDIDEYYGLELIHEDMAEAVSWRQLVTSTFTEEFIDEAYDKCVIEYTPRASSWYIKDKKQAAKFYATNFARAIRNEHKIECDTLEIIKYSIVGGFGATNSDQKHKRLQDITAKLEDVLLEAKLDSKRINNDANRWVLSNTIFVPLNKGKYDSSKVILSTSIVTDLFIGIEEIRVRNTILSIGEDSIDNYLSMIWESMISVYQKDMAKALSDRANKKGSIVNEIKYADRDTLYTMVES